MNEPLPASMNLASAVYGTPARAWVAGEHVAPGHEHARAHRERRRPLQHAGRNFVKIEDVDLRPITQLRAASTVASQLERQNSSGQEAPGGPNEG